METLCIIPARGGSKTVPRKNLVKIGGLSLIEHAAECVKRAKSIDRTVLSTDSQEIADCARVAGLEVPFLRPAELARDDTTDWPVFHHCLQWLKETEGYQPEIVVHLRVTSPFAFKRVKDGPCGIAENWAYVKREKVVDEAVSFLKDNRALDAVRTVKLVRDTPYKMWKIQDGLLEPFVKSNIKEIYNQPRQKIPLVYLQNGYVDVSLYRTIIHKESMYGDVIGAYVLECDYLVDIDEFPDIELGELIYKQVLLRSEFAADSWHGNKR